MNTSQMYFAFPLMVGLAILLYVGCTPPSDNTPESTPAPSNTPIPQVTAMDLYLECEGTDSPDQKLRRTFMGAPLPECYLEGERLRIAGHLYDVNTEDEEGDVNLTVEYWLNSESRMVFGGIILRDIPRSAREDLQNLEVVIADCTVAHSAPIGLMGTGRVLTDCELFEAPE